MIFEVHGCAGDVVAPGTIGGGPLDHHVSSGHVSRLSATLNPTILVKSSKKSQGIAHGQAQAAQHAARSKDGQVQKSHSPLFAHARCPTTARLRRPTPDAESGPRSRHGVPDSACPGGCADPRCSRAVVLRALGHGCLLQHRTAPAPRNTRPNEPSQQPRHRRLHVAPADQAARADRVS